MSDLPFWVEPTAIIAVVLYVWRRIDNRLGALSNHIADVDRRVARIEGLLEGVGLKSTQGTPLSQPPGGPPGPGP